MVLGVLLFFLIPYDLVRFETLPGFIPLADPGENTSDSSAAPLLWVASIVTPPFRSGVPASTRPLDSCGALTKSGATYLLQKDVSAADSCFSIQAPDVTLNLNGHTVTFATAPTGRHRYGIVGLGCKHNEADPKACGGSWQNAVIFNGFIKEDPAGSAIGFMDGIRNGPENDSACENWTVHDVDITMNQGKYTNDTAPFDSRALAFNYCAGSARIYNVRTHIGYGRVGNRSDIRGPAMRLMPSMESGNGKRPYKSPYCGATTPYTPSQEICNNTIEGGTQGGIAGKTDYRHIYGNHVAPNSSATNDFAIYAWGGFAEVDHNTIDAISSRGIQASGGGSGHDQKIHDNNVTVRMLPQYCGDSGQSPCNNCEPSGTYGIQFDDTVENATAFGNTVSAYADQCPATALKITDSGPKDTSHDNVYKAFLVGTKCASGGAICFSNAVAFASGVDSTPMTMTNDTFSGDDDQVYVDYGVPNGATFIHCTFIKPPTASSRHVFIRWGIFSTKAGQALHFRDSIFQGGENPDTNVMFPINGNHPPEEYFIDWTYTLAVKDGKGSPVPQATVSIVDNSNRQAFTGTTDVSGEISAVLNQIHWLNSPSGHSRQANGPYKVSVSAPNCSPSSLTVDVNQTTHASAQLVCH